ncbi:MAG TPA: thioredoxin family protein [Devosia sp.]|nr:thioredoxin family protein [Devosia sp.]
MPVSPDMPELGVKAAGFTLPATDGKMYSLSDIMGENGAVIAFICNHCPYVRAITDRMVADARTLQKLGVGFGAICSNDANKSPDDSFENMVVFAKERGFNFPYLHDESQEVARAYEAVCTPDFFGLNAEGLIEYRGRMDEGRTTPPPQGAKRDLVEAMAEIVRTGKGPEDQIASAGCSIKWK